MIFTGNQRRGEEGRGKKERRKEGKENQKFRLLRVLDSSSIYL